MRWAVLLLLLSACDKLFDINRIRHVDGGDTDDDSGVVADTPGTDATDIGSGLLAYYPLEGSAWEDASGNGHTGSCIGMCPLPAQPGHRGNAFSFSMNRVDVPGMELATPAGFTVSLWINVVAIDAVNGSCPINKLLGPITTTLADSWQFCLDTAGKPRFMSNDGTNLNTVGLNGTLTQNAWHHIALVWDGTSRSKQLWIDGLMIAASTVPIAFDAGPVVVGTDSNGNTSTGWFYGLLDEVRIYNRALSSAEIVALLQ